MGAVPHELDRHALLRELVRSRVPARHHVALAVADELLRLVALRPPHLDVRLDLVELPEGAVEVERVDLVGRHAVGQEREHQRARRAVVERARAGKLLDVLEIRP